MNEHQQLIRYYKWDAGEISPLPAKFFFNEWKTKETESNESF